MKPIRDDIKDGLDSGFSLCCIVYFLVRRAIYGLTGKLIQLKQPKESQHVLCPFHIWWHSLMPMRYHNCTTCNWKQYNKPKCVKCVSCKHEYNRGEANCLICNYRRGTIGCVVAGNRTIIPIYEERDFGVNYENRV